jgi:hypothetical protein
MHNQTRPEQDPEFIAVMRENPLHVFVHRAGQAVDAGKRQWADVARIYGEAIPGINVKDARALWAQADGAHSETTQAFKRTCVQDNIRRFDNAWFSSASTAIGRHRAVLLTQDRSYRRCRSYDVRTRQLRVRLAARRRG